MVRMKLIFMFFLVMTSSSIALAQTEVLGRTALVARAEMAASQQNAHEGPAALDAPKENRALQVFLKYVQTQIVSAADAMPAVKYGFAPTDGEFKGVRTFGQQVKHLAATNHILAAAALGEDTPADAGDEMGPDTVRTKAEILDYLDASFAHLGKAIDAIDDKNSMVKSLPISSLKRTA